MFLVLMVCGLAGLVAMALPAFGKHAHGLKAIKAHTRFIPSVRLVFSVLALYGAFANALERAAHLSPLVAGIVALVPAVVVERFAVSPLWNLVFRLEGQPVRPLAELVTAEATAVTSFKNGRGVVSIVREGRLVQLPARLVDGQAALPVRTGDRLHVQDVEAPERLVVSVGASRPERS